MKQSEKQKYKTEIDDLKRENAILNIQNGCLEDHIRKTIDKIFLAVIITATVLTLLIMAAELASTEVYDLIDSPEVTKNIGGYNCALLNQNFVDWEDNFLICETTTIDFNKPVYFIE